MPGRCTLTTTSSAPSSVSQTRAVHLADGRGRERLLVEAHEQIRELDAERALDCSLIALERHRRHVVLELLQLDDHVRRQDVGARRGDLPELDERRAEVLEHQPHAHAPARTRGARGRRGSPRSDAISSALPLLRPAGGCESLPLRGRPSPTPAHDLAEAVAHEHRGDVAKPADVTRGVDDRNQLYHPPHSSPIWLSPVDSCERSLSRS